MKNQDVYRWLAVRVRDRLGSLRASRALKRAAAAAATPEQIVEALLTVPYGNPRVTPTQVRSEIVEFVARVRAIRPRRVLEIGTARGGTLYLLAWASADDARILSLDVRDFRRRLRLYRSFARGRQKVEVLLRDSHLPATREAVEKFFRRQAVDVLFIDGDHTYEGVRRDFDLYSPLVRPGGLVAIHDIVDGPEIDVGGVPDFWRELKASADETEEIVESWAQGGYGIGLLRRSG